MTRKHIHPGCPGCSMYHLLEPRVIPRRTPLVAWLLLPIVALLAFCVAFTLSAVCLLLT